MSRNYELKQIVRVRPRENYGKKMKFEMVLGKEHVSCILLNKEAPKTCEQFWKTLPFESTVNHAKVSGRELMVPVTFFSSLENPRVAQEAGNMCFWPFRQIVAIFYGSSPGVGAISLFAKIEENLEGLQRVGRTVWFKQGQRIAFNKIEE
jgi:hypothetical protein